MMVRMRLIASGMAMVALFLMTPLPVVGQDCKAAASSPVTYVPVPGQPFSAIPSPDGCWLFVSLSPATPAMEPGIAVLHRTAGTASVNRVIRLKNLPSGLELTHDGRLLLVAVDDGLAILGVASIVSNGEQPIVGYIPYGIAPPPISPETRQFVASQMGTRQAAQLKTPGSIYVNVTRNDRFAFISNEWVQTISVIDLEKARRSGFGSDAIVGRIPTALAPIALTFSPDERYLYTTSEAAAGSDHWPAVCKPEGQDPTAQAQPDNPTGAILVIDVALATSDASHAVVAKVPAGCTPVRLVLSPSGDTAFVTARNSNAVLVFDTRKLVSDSAHAQITSIPVGASPVGMALFDRGRRLAVTNSNRFAGDSTKNETLNVIDTGKIKRGPEAIAATIPTNGFPREARLMPDGRTLVVTNYTSQTVELIDVSRAVELQRTNRK